MHAAAVAAAPELYNSSSSCGAATGVRATRVSPPSYTTAAAPGVGSALGFDYNASAGRLVLVEHSNSCECAWP